MKRSFNDISQSKSSSSTANDNLRTPAPQTNSPNSIDPPNIYQPHQVNQATNEDLTRWKNGYNFLNNLIISAHTQPILISSSKLFGPPDSTPDVTITNQFSEQAFGRALEARDYKTCIKFLEIFPILFKYAVKYKENILMIAAKEKNVELFKLLPALLPDRITRLKIINRGNDRGDTALMLAAETEDNVELITAISSSVGNDKSIFLVKNKSNDNALDIAIENNAKNNLRAMTNMLPKFFYGGSAPLSSMSDKELMFAATYGMTDSAKILLNSSQDLFLTLFHDDENGATPLMHACRNNHTDIIELLLEACADKNQIDKLITRTDFNDRTALIMAAERGSKEAISILLKSVNDPVGLILMRESNGHGALTLALNHHYTAGLDMLLDPLGPEGIAELIKRWDYAGDEDPPFIFASICGHRHFPSAEININELDLAAIMMAQDNIRDSWLHIAIRRDMFEMIPLLFNALPDNEMKQQFAELINNEQETALMLAIQNGDVIAIAHLLSHVPDPRRLILMTDTNGDNMMELARSEGNWNVVSALENVFPDL